MDNQTSSAGTEIPLSLLWRIFRKYWILLAIIAVVVSVPLYTVLRLALKRSGLLEKLG